MASFRSRIKLLSSLPWIIWSTRPDKISLLPDIFPSTCIISCCSASDPFLNTGVTISGSCPSGIAKSDKSPSAVVRTIPSESFIPLATTTSIFVYPRLWRFSIMAARTSGSGCEFKNFSRESLKSVTCNSLSIPAAAITTDPSDRFKNSAAFAFILLWTSTGFLFTSPR